MATAHVPRSNVYLSHLAAKALTALADLAHNPSEWNERIRLGLTSGIEYCELYRSSGLGYASRRDRQDVKRHAVDSKGAVVEFDAHDQCDKIRRLLETFLARKREPNDQELRAAIDFFGTD